MFLDGDDAWIRFGKIVPINRQGALKMFFRLFVKGHLETKSSHIFVTDGDVRMVRIVRTEILQSELQRLTKTFSSGVVVVIDQLNGTEQIEGRRFAERKILTFGKRIDRHSVGGRIIFLTEEVTGDLNEDEQSTRTSSRVDFTL